MNTWNYDKISPLTGNKSVVSNPDMDLCLETGYHWMNWNEGFEEKLPLFIKESVFVDSNGLNWYKIISFSPNSILLPLENGNWGVNSFRNITDDENFEVVRTNPDVGRQALDPNCEVQFVNFIDALNEFQKRNNEN